MYIQQYKIFLCINTHTVYLTCCWPLLETLTEGLTQREDSHTRSPTFLQLCCFSSSYSYFSHCCSFTCSPLMKICCHPTYIIYIPPCILMSRCVIVREGGEWKLFNIKYEKQLFAASSDSKEQQRDRCRVQTDSCQHLPGRLQSPTLWRLCVTNSQQSSVFFFNLPDFMVRWCLMRIFSTSDVFLTGVFMLDSCLQSNTTLSIYTSLWITCVNIYSNYAVQADQWSPQLLLPHNNDLWLTLSFGDFFLNTS